MQADCGICGQYDDDSEHLNLYVTGSEGIWVCFRCRIALTETAKALKSLANRVELNIRRRVGV